jgi:glycerol uptake facilitator-like aquaporin
VSSFPAHISGFPVLLLLLLLFCSSSQIRCQFGRGVHNQLLILIDFATSNLVSMYVQQQCSAFFSFFVLFLSVFWAANSSSSSSSSSYCTSFRFPFWVLCCFLSFGHEM